MCFRTCLARAFVEVGEISAGYLVFERLDMSASKWVAIEELQESVAELLRLESVQQTSIDCVCSAIRTAHLMGQKEAHEKVLAKINELEK